MNTVYLDYAAATPLDKAVCSVMRPYFSDKFFNPSAIYMAAKDVRKDLEEARAQVARILGCRPGEVLFAAGGTEANNLAIKGVMDRFPGEKIIISSVEHESVRQPAGRYDVEEAVVDNFGRVKLSELEKQINDQTVLISVVYASSEVGTIQPIAEIGKLVKKVKQERAKKGLKLPLYFHTDACQAAQYLSLSVDRLGVDLMTINGGKIYGPKQSAILFVRSGALLSPLIEGGGQERKMRSGTENVAFSIGLCKALQMARENTEMESDRILKLSQRLRDGLSGLNKNITFLGDPKNRLPNHTMILIPGSDNERLMMELDEKGYQVATGSACSASKQEASHSLLAMGISEQDAHSAIRISLGKQTSAKQIDGFVMALRECLIS